MKVLYDHIHRVLIPFLKCESYQAEQSVFYISLQVKELKKKKNPSIDCIYLYHHRQTKATL